MFTDSWNRESDPASSCEESGARDGNRKSPRTFIVKQCAVWYNEYVVKEPRTQIVEVSPQSASYDKLIAHAGELLREGHLVAFPTETVYGLAANAERPDAIERLREAKGRQEDKPFAFIVCEREEVERYVKDVPSTAHALMGAFWPGPLTLVLRAGDGKTIGFRMPDDRIALDLIRAAKVRLVAPSANISGSAEPRTAEEVERQLGGKVELTLDGGPTRIGIPSTVVLVEGSSYKILRAGAISEDRIREVVQEQR